MSQLQDSSVSIPVTPLPLKHHRQRKQNASPGISLLAGATAGAIEAAITVSPTTKHIPLSTYFTNIGLFSIHLSLPRLAYS
jgi:hypothetical protein